MDNLLICLSFTSLSAVMAGISVALRNFAFSALVQIGTNVFKMGDVNYKEILKKSAKYSTFAGIIFIINTIMGIIVTGMRIYYEIPDIVVFILLMVLFAIGMILFLICLVSGHLKFVTPEPPATEEVTETEQTSKS